PRVPAPAVRACEKEDALLAQRLDGRLARHVAHGPGTVRGGERRIGELAFLESVLGHHADGEIRERLSADHRVYRVGERRPRLTAEALHPFGLHVAEATNAHVPL